MAARIDWNEWRLKYVSGGDEVTLEALSKAPGAPALNTLKKRSSRESWAEQRERFRHQRDTIAHHDATVMAAASEVKKIIDAAEMLTRHAQLSKLMGAIAAYELSQIRQKQQHNAPTGLEASDVMRFAKLAMESERLTEGLATQRQEIDLSGLSDAELERMANGG
jgi:hypothetical protein